MNLRLKKTLANKEKLAIADLQYHAIQDRSKSQSFIDKVQNLGDEWR